jgi:hypothetical protein
MDQLIQKIAAKSGLEEAVVKKALGALLVYLQHQTSRDGGFNFKRLILDQIPGFESALQGAVPKETSDTSSGSNDRAAPADATTSNTSPFHTCIGIVLYLFQLFGVMAMLKSLLERFFGPDAAKLISSVGDGAELVALLHRLGVSREQGTQMVNMVLQFVQEKVGAETVDQLKAYVPALKAFLEESKKKQ